MDFIQNHSPTARAASIPLLVGSAVNDNTTLHHLDAAQSFVQADNSEEFSLKLPPGCGYLKGEIVRLDKTLYGFPRQAYFEFNKLLSGDV